MASRSSLDGLLANWGNVMEECSSDEEDITRNKVQTLVELSSCAIAKDTTFTCRVLPCVPIDLYSDLMKASFQLNQCGAIIELMKRWPTPLLRVGSILPKHVHTNICYFPSEGIFSKCIFYEWTRSRMILFSFIGALRQKKLQHLNTLDMWGYFLGDKEILSVCEEIMQLHSFGDMCSLVPSPVKRGRPELDDTSTEDSNAQTRGHTCYTLRVDCSISREDSCDNLLEILALQKCCTNHRCVKLELRRLIAASLGETRVLFLIGAIDPKNLSGLSVHFNDLRNKGLSILLQSVPLMTSLRCLNLSTNQINLYTNHDLAILLGSTLGQLPNLRRLDLSSNRLTACLRIVLNAIQNPLEFLNISATRMVECDLVYLANSKHVKGLKELDISDNTLTDHVITLIRLLTGAKETLRILEVESCALNVSGLISTLLLLSQLKIVNVYNNFIEESTLDNFAQLANLKHLEIVKISHPSSVETTADRTEIEDRFESVMATIRMDQGNPNTVRAKFY